MPSGLRTGREWIPGVVGKPLAQPKPGEMGIGELDEKGIPKTIEGYQRLNAILAATDKNLTEIQFGEQGKTIQVDPHRKRRSWYLFMFMIKKPTP